MEAEKLIDALDSVTWYNGLAKYVYRWSVPGYLTENSGFPTWKRLEEDLEQREMDQLEVIWMICVESFGDCGTSPRTGWIEKLEEFYEFCRAITKTWQEAEGEDMMGKGIKISEKHGLNPTIPLCFWCGEEKKEVALLGKLKDDAEAPRSTWINGDYEPCDKCAEKMNLGITMIEAKKDPCGEGQAPYMGTAYPTGNWMVILPTGIPKLFKEDVREEILEHRRIFVEPEVYAEIERRIEGDEGEQKEGDTDAD